MNSKHSGHIDHIKCDSANIVHVLALHVRKDNKSNPTKSKEGALLVISVALPPERHSENDCHKVILDVFPDGDNGAERKKWIGENVSLYNLGIQGRKWKVLVKKIEGGQLYKQCHGELVKIPFVKGVYKLKRAAPKHLKNPRDERIAFLKITELPCTLIIDSCRKHHGDLIKSSPKPPGSNHRSKDSFFDGLIVRPQKPPKELKILESHRSVPRLVQAGGMF